MISLEAAVMIVIYLLVAIAVFGILFSLVSFVGSKFPQAPWIINVAHMILAILAALVAIGFLLSLVSGKPLFKP